MERIPFLGKEYLGTTEKPVSSVGYVLRKMEFMAWLSFGPEHVRIEDAHIFIAVLEGTMWMLMQMRGFHDKKAHNLPMFMTSDSKAAQSILECLSQVQ
jgi:hypothetical protein